LKPNANYSGRTAPLTSKVAFCVFIQQISVLNILNMAYTLRFFFSKCSLFHSSNVFGSCIIHILYTGVLKLKKLFRRQKVNAERMDVAGLLNGVEFAQSKYPPRNQLPDRTFVAFFKTVS